MEVCETVLKVLSEHGVRARTDICGRDCTSFRIGGRIGIFCEPEDVEQLKTAVRAASEAGYCCYVIGNGSNLLIPDEGIDAMLIRPAGELADFAILGNTLYAGAGASLAAAAKASVNAGLMGLEWAAGIPGTVGGAVAMNAGAYGGEIKDVIGNVAVLRENEVETVPVMPDDMGYRRSRFSFPGCIVLAAEFKLLPDDGGARERMREYNEKRRAKQPVELPSAGSTFKRPEGHFAAALIDEAGLKGASVGGACVSPKHAGFIVNNGGATCRDVLELMDIVTQTVYSKFGVTLEPEVRILK